MDKIKNYFYKYLDRKTLKFIGVISVVVLGTAVIIISAIIDQQKDLSLQRSKAAEIGACDVQFTISQLTLTPTPPAYITPTITLTPTPTTPPTPTISPTLSCKNLDIALVIDRSATMNDIESDGRRKLEWAKDAAKGFVQEIQNTGTTSVKVAVSSFGAQGNDGTGILTSEYNSSLNSLLSGNLPSVITAINNVVHIKPGTCIECGLRIGNNELKNTGSRKVAILLSDGMANHNWDGTTNDSIVKAIVEANKGRTNGIEYRVLGYGLKSKNQIDESTLLNIAGHPLYYQYKPNVSDWSDAFLTILQELCGATPPPPQPIATLYSIADATVFAGTNANQNFGSATSLSVDGSPVEITYFKFDLSSLAGKTFKKATLKFNTVDSSDGQENVKSTSTSWNEGTITYNNRPTSTGVVTNFRGGVSGYLTQIDVTSFVETNKGGIISLMFDTTSTDGLDFSSKESTIKPVLVID